MPCRYIHSPTAYLHRDDYDNGLRLIKAVLNQSRASRAGTREAAFMELHDPKSVGMDAKRLDRIAPIMEGFVRENQLPGIMTLVQRHGKVVHLGKYGLMDIEAGKPMQEDALFRIYSMTKPIICVALMMLYEQRAASA